MTSCRFDPSILIDLPIGMFHCPHCGIMVVAGLKHLSDEDCQELDPNWEPPIYEEDSNS